MLTGIVLGSLYFIFAFVISMATIYLCFRLVIRVTKYDDIALLLKNNTAVSIVLTSAFISMAIMARNALYPIFAVIQDFWLASSRAFSEYLYLLATAGGYLLVTIVLSLVSVIAALLIFSKLTTEIDEESEIKKNNVAVGLLLGGVLIAFAIMIDSGIGDFVNSLIPAKDVLNS